MKNRQIDPQLVAKLWYKRFKPLCKLFCFEASVSIDAGVASDGSTGLRPLREYTGSN